MLYKNIVLLSILILLSGDLWSQKNRRPTSTASYRGRYNSVRVSKSKAKVVCPVFEVSQYPYHSLGIKVGDPFALSYKFYANEHFSFAFDAGKTSSGLYSGYYRDNFNNLTNPDTLEQDQSVNYLGHLMNKDWIFEGKLLYQQDASSLLEGLQFYIGAGLQWRNTSIQYEFLTEESFNRTEINVLNNAYTTIGPVGVIGIEYSYFSIPIAAFMEIEWYYDVMQDPGWNRFQGGVGLRYAFLR